MPADARNPYATPKAVVADAGASPEAEATRNEHVTHEASVKSAGFLFVLGGLGALFGSLGMVIPSIATAAERPGFLVLGIMLAGLAVAYIVVGWGLRGLRQWSRSPGIALAAIGLLGFPVGTVINAYILWLVVSKKGQTVLSPDYAAVIEATPHIRYRTSAVAWIVLALVVLAFLAMIFALP